MNSLNDVMANIAQIIGAAYALAVAINKGLRLFGLGNSPLAKALDRVSLTMEPMAKPSTEKAQ